ncbi:MAG: MscS Mechanosensitive ion channel [Nitrosospira sp.]
MLCQFDFKQTRRLLAAAAFPLLFLPVFYPGDSIFAAEPAANAPAAENSSAPAAPAITVTPAQARQALAILQDEKKRAELAETLNAIVLAMEMREGVEPGPAPPVPAKPAEEKGPEAPIELTEGGLVAQLFDSIGKRLDAIGDQARLTARTMLEIRTVGEWWQYNLGDAERRAVVLGELWKVAAILGGALLADWLLRWALARSRGLVESRAAARQAAINRKKDEVTASALPISSPSAATVDSGSSGPPGTAVRGGNAADRHLSLLRRFPFALAHWLLELVPLAGFVAVATILLNAFGGRAAVFYSVTLPLIDAYSTTRIALSVVHLMVSPLGQGLRLIHISDGGAAYVNAWLRRIIIVAVFGSAIAEVALQTGAIPSTGIALSKLVGLVIHAMLLIMVFRSRKEVAEAIRGSDTANPAMTGLRAAAASAWPFAATVFIVATWVLWSVGAEDGFQRALEIFGWSAAVVVGASLVSIFALGWIDRAFIADRENMQQQTNHAGQPGQARQEASAVQSPYHLLALRTVSLVIAISALIVLLQVWGVDTLSWFQAGSIGRRLAAALATIAVTCALAFAAWEALNMTLHRRIERWTAVGDTARAARLRTLVPMLRTTLLFAIGTVVLLAALDQLGISIGPLVAGASIIGVALGFGSQKLVQDFITGIFLLMENAIQVGDTITVADVSGTVEYLSIRTVRLRAGDGSLHVVPFSSVSTVTNTNRGFGNASIRVSVKADSDVDKVFAAIRSVGEEMRADAAFKNLILADADIWGVDQIDGATITVLGQIRTVDRGRWPVQRGFNRRILQRFREAGIQLMNPQERKVAAQPRIPVPEARTQADDDGG